MAVNKYYIKKPINEPYINLTFEMDWYNEGQEDSIEIFQTDAVEEVVGTPTDFETARFRHNDYICSVGANNIPATCSDINYEFYFFSGNPKILIYNYNWSNSYFAKNINNITPFSVSELYYNSNTFSKSFFKLDLYDLPDEKAQTNYLTIILPTQQGFTETAILSSLLPSVDVKKPKFKLDYVGDKEGFFIYWLRKTTFISADTFYMSAKFFDARDGQFTKMMVVPQSTFTSGGSEYSFDGQKYFYYKVVLNYSGTTYEVFDYVGNRAGTTTNPIKWYEYVNP
jgi:hypothetical protein